MFRRFYFVFFAILFLGLSGVLQAQRVSNLQAVVFDLNGDTIKIDSLSIVPGTLIIEDLYHQRIVPPSDYVINEAASILIWKNKPLSDSILITYRVFPYELSKEYFHKDITKVGDDISKLYAPFVYNPFEDNESSGLEFGTLNYSGSFSRGISFGNNQDLVPTSDLNLQISGMLNDVEIVAAITDQNVPLQPEGNTQQLQEFDKIFIQLKWKRSKLIMGDYELKRPDSYFMNFYKRAKGADFSNSLKIGEKSELKSKASIAFSKGQYYRYSFSGEESNQGPYKLKGKSGEIFIIILAGTERVYIDGELLKRGGEKDYVIDYNTAELTFTPKRLITKDKRIVIEYEYSNQYYNRFVTHLGTEYKREKVSWKFNFFSEQDNKNKPIQEYSDEQSKLIRETLSQVGDNIDQAYISGVGIMDFDSSRIMYAMVDTTIIDTVANDTTTYDSVFIYSIDPVLGRYVLSFTFVGQNNGNYIIAQNGANGRVYQWVPPQNGVKQGRYEPIIILVAPRIKQMYTLGMDYKISKNNQLITELALSNNDINTFSEKDNDDNIGYAGKIGYKNLFTLNNRSKKDLTLTSTIHYEHLNKDFTPIEEYRPVEFERDWNIESTDINTNEDIGSIEVNLKKEKLMNIGYRLARFIKGDSIYDGIMHSVHTKLESGGFRILGTGSYLESESLKQQTQFFRPKLDVSKGFAKLRGWRIGAAAEREENRIYASSQKDTLSPNSFKFDILKLYVNNADTLSNKIRVLFTKRYDYSPVLNHFDTTTIANTYTVGADLIKNPNSQFRGSITYRELKIIDTAFTNLKPDESVLGRIEYMFILKKGLLRSSTLYELGTGQEQKLEFSFVKVAKGEGQYIYLGDNNDNGVSDLDEFELSSFANDGDYIKVYSPTNEYEKANSVQFNQVLNLSPRAIWFSKKGLKKFIGRFSSQSSLHISRKSFDEGKGFPFNPFIVDADKIPLVTLSTIIRNSLYFNRVNPKFGAEINWQDNRRQALLINGFESVRKQEEGASLRWNISKRFATEIKAKTGRKVNESEFFTQKNYIIRYDGVAPHLTFLAKKSFRLTVFYKFRESFNRSGPEVAFNNEVGTEIKYNLVSRSTLNLSGSYISIAYGPGKTNSPVGYAMLEGLQRGDNILWSATYDRKLGANVQMSMNYEGRKTGESDVVHIGRVHVRAVF